MSSDGAAHLDCDGVRRIFIACTRSSSITSDHANAHENRERTKASGGIKAWRPHHSKHCAAYG
jgi:hypothetical protein